MRDVIIVLVALALIGLVLAISDVRGRDAAITRCTDRGGDVVTTDPSPVVRCVGGR